MMQVADHSAKIARGRELRATTGMTLLAIATEVGMDRASLGRHLRDIVPPLNVRSLSQITANRPVKEKAVRPDRVASRMNRVKPVKAATAKALELLEQDPSIVANKARIRLMNAIAADLKRRPPPPITLPYITIQHAPA